MDLIGAAPGFYPNAGTCEYITSLREDRPL